MKKEEIMYGISLGYKLGRLEFLWDSNIQEAINEFPNAKNEILGMLSDYNVCLNEENYQKFIESILEYFERVNSNMEAWMLVGIGAYRNFLLKRTRNEQLKPLAKSAFEAVSEKVIPEPMSLYNSFEKENPESIDKMVDLVLKHLENPNAGSVDELFF